MKKVLLADDDYTMVSLLKTLLTMEGYEVETLLDKPGEIVNNIRKIKPDILLMDVYLGDRNGLDVVRKVRKAAGLKDIRIVMVSGIDKTEECKAAGADEFLLKPYMPSELFDILRA
jgi:DNA-binding response OmpR family regulator